MNHVPPVSITLKNYVHVKAALRISSETADLVTFTEEILNGKLHFLCSGDSIKRIVILAQIQSTREASYRLTLMVNCQTFCLRLCFCVRMLRVAAMA